MTTATFKRVRFAPSPTGFLHLGGLRTALFNYLQARSAAGSFILRIEDTDRKRTVPGAVERLLEMLDWAGLRPDEGPGSTTSRTPSQGLSYVQSERLDYYHRIAAEMLQDGTAYKCVCPPGRKTEGGFLGRYGGQCRRSRPTDAQLASGYVIRFAAPMGGSDETSHDCHFDDVVYGRIVTKDPLDDVILVKSDGFPTYHFASVCDDHEMQVDLVLRGQEWLPSTGLHKALYRALQWPAPATAHLPLLRSLSDRQKLSKRQQAASVEHYRRSGFLPEALLNFTALLGWTPPPRPGGMSSGEVQPELMGLADMARSFSLHDLNRADALVDPDRLLWFNRKHIERGRTRLARDLVQMSPVALSAEHAGDILNVLAGRIVRLEDIFAQHRYFFEDPREFASDGEQASPSSRSLAHLGDLLIGLRAAQDPLTREQVESLMGRQTRGDRGEARENMLTARVALTGVSVGGPLVPTMCLLGRETCIRRLEAYLNRPSA